MNKNIKARQNTLRKPSQVADAILVVTSSFAVVIVTLMLI